MTWFSQQPSSLQRLTANPPLTSPAHVVDFVEQVVGLGGQFLATLLTTCAVTGGVVVLAATAAALGLFLSHRCLLLSSGAVFSTTTEVSSTGEPPASTVPSGYRPIAVNRPQFVSWSTSSAALSTESSSSPT